MENNKVRKGIFIAICLYFILAISRYISNVGNDQINEEVAQKKQTDKGIEIIEDETQREDFEILGYDVIVTADHTYEEGESEETAFDLILSQQHPECYVHFMVYNKADLVESIQCKDIQELQIGEIKSKRKNINVVLQNEVYRDNEEVLIYKSIFTGENDFSKNKYYCYCIDLKNKDVIIWVLANGVPSAMQGKDKEIDAIVDSVRSK